MTKGTTMRSNRTTAVLPELERSLAAGAAGQNRSSRLSAIRGRAGRVAAIGATCLAFGGTAMAATGVWNPGIGDKAPNTPPPAVSTTAVPAAMAESVGAFRRAPNAQDHGPAVEATLSTLGSQFADGIRPDSVRYLEENASGEATILLSSERSIFTSGKGMRLFGSGEPACVVIPDGGEAVPTCFGLDKILAGEAVSQLERIDHLTGKAWGLVPDGVASVTARFGDGTIHQIPVTDNHFVYRWGNPEANPLGGEVSLVSWTTPSIGIVWHDADGNVVPQQPAS
jgi:hypothetical protein